MLSIVEVIVKVIKVNKKWFLPSENTQWRKKTYNPTSLPIPLPLKSHSKIKKRVQCDHGDKRSTLGAESIETSFVDGEVETAAWRRWQLSWTLKNEDGVSVDGNSGVGVGGQKTRLEEEQEVGDRHCRSRQAKVGRYT